MFNSEILEVAIGLVFFYLLLSLLVTTINEIIASVINLRGKTLKDAIFSMLDQADDKANPASIVHSILDHPRIKSLTGRKLPSFIQPATFAKVLTELIKKNGTQSDSNPDPNDPQHDPSGNNADAPASSDLQEAIDKLGLSADLTDNLSSLATEAGQNIAVFRDKVADWFDEVMVETTAWYTRRMKRFALAVGFVLAVAFNADTIKIVHKLSTDSTARKAVVAQAVDFAAAYDSVPTPNHKTSTTKQLLDSAKVLVNENLKSANTALGIGWSGVEIKLESCKDIGRFFLWLVGILITTLALSLGAPFWFDLLKKLVNIRSSGVSPSEKKTTEKKGVG